MNFKAQREADLSAVFFNTDDFAEVVDIESADGDDAWLNVPAIMEYGIQDDYGGTGSILERARLTIPAIGDKAPPRVMKGDCVTVAGVVWTVDLPKRSMDGLLWEMELVK